MFELSQLFATLDAHTESAATRPPTAAPGAEDWKRVLDSLVASADRTASPETEEVSAEEDPEFGSAPVGGSLSEAIPLPETEGAVPIEEPTATELGDVVPAAESPPEPRIDRAAVVPVDETLVEATSPATTEPVPSDEIPDVARPIRLADATRPVPTETAAEGRTEAAPAPPDSSSGELRPETAATVRAEPQAPSPGKPAATPTNGPVVRGEGPPEGFDSAVPATEVPLAVGEDSSATATRSGDFDTEPEQPGPARAEASPSETPSRPRPSIAESAPAGDVRLPAQPRADTGETAAVDSTPERTIAAEPAPDPVADPAPDRGDRVEIDADGLVPSRPAVRPEAHAGSDETPQLAELDRATDTEPGATSTPDPTIAESARSVDPATTRRSEQSPRVAIAEDTTPTRPASEEHDPDTPTRVAETTPRPAPEVARQASRPTAAPETVAVQSAVAGMGAARETPASETEPDTSPDTGPVSDAHPSIRPASRLASTVTSNDRQAVSARYAAEAETMSGEPSAETEESLADTLDAVEAEFDSLPTERVRVALRTPATTHTGANPDKGAPSAMMGTMAAADTTAAGPASSSAEAATPVRHAALAQAIASRARTIPDGGVVELRFALEPEELGPVRVRIESRGEQIKIQILAANGAALETLQSGLARFNSQLQEGGIRDPEIDLALGSFTDTDGGRQRDTQDGSADERRSTWNHESTRPSRSASAQRRGTSTARLDRTA